jgi:hypothetical protein
MQKLRFLICAALLAPICLTIVSVDRTYAGDRIGSPAVIPPDFIAMPSGGCAKPAN